MALHPWFDYMHRRAWNAADLLDLQMLSSAVQAAGSALAVVDAVMKGAQGASQTKGFAVIRPPGHHATKEAPMGFCLFNNVAIAARYAQQRYGLRKVPPPYCGAPGPCAEGAGLQAEHDLLQPESCGMMLL